MDHLNGTEVEGSCIEVTLAKPVDKEQYTRYQKASKGGTVAAPAETPQPNYIYQCDPYTLTYYGYPYSTLIGPNRDYFVKGKNTLHVFMFLIQFEYGRICAPSIIVFLVLLMEKAVRIFSCLHLI